MSADHSINSCSTCAGVGFTGLGSCASCGGLGRWLTSTHSPSSGLDAPDTQERYRDALQKIWRITGKAALELGGHGKDVVEQVQEISAEALNDG